ncbi:MAG: hypothetical protein KAH10_04725 [Flavobacteriales bacterium]|nr:hypothetical protein [Flavobacteriales bacterium]
MKILRLFIIPFFAIAFSLTSCYKDKDEPINGGQDSEALSVNKFILENMTNYYLWTDHIPGNLDPSSTDDSKAFFEKMRYKGVGDDTKGDPWSFITDDLQGLLEMFEGIRTSKGYYLYGYSRGENDDRLALVVAYAYNNSPASEAGLTRGSVILEIDGNDLTSANVNQFLSKESYSITLGEYDRENETFILLDETRTLTAVELSTNPIIKSEIYDIKGTKIAYLLYNSFIHKYDRELIYEFEKYKAEGVSELILDFRYNGGGSVASALNISSMIAPKSDIGKVFLKKEYNTVLQDYLLNHPNYGEDFLEDKLTSEAYGYGEDDDITGMPLTNLDLDRVYIIGLDGTASASELVINGLKPYMNVITLGDRTHGKYVASITIQDETYDNWAIQPIVFKSANANGETDYWNGFTPALEASDWPHLGDFGIDKENNYVEHILAFAIADITGSSAKSIENIDIEKSSVKMPFENSKLDRGMVYDIK